MKAAWFRIAIMMAFLLFFPASPQAAEVPYAVEFAGIEEAALREMLEGVSQLVALRDRPPATVAALRRRADADMEPLRQVLRAKGWYAAKLSYRIDSKTTPATLTVQIDPGPRYRIAAFTIAPLDPVAMEPVLSDPAFALKSLGVEIGSPAESAAILEAERRLVALLGERAFPFARVIKRDVVIDHEARAATATLSLQSGPAARFGRVTIDGLEKADPRFVRTYIRWRDGQPYDSRLVARLRRDLDGSGVFAAVKVEPAAAIEPDGRLPINIALVEAKRRFVGGGVKYSTSEGPGAKLFWGHRNLFGGGERLELTGRVSELLYGGEANFRRPNVFLFDQDLLLDGKYEIQDTDAYESRSLDLSAGLERRLSKALSFSYGVTLSQSAIDEVAESTTFNLIGLPLGLRRDTTDNLLDPSRGGRLTLKGTPYYSSEATFFSALLRDTVYLPLLEENRLVAAGWASVGSIFGAPTDDIPATKRLYSGGGGSIRGYGYQLVGPLDANNIPTGGRSSLEAGVELRYRLTDTIGIAPFLEGGNVSHSALPRLDEEFLFGAGIGLRYYTPVGPLRLDVAVPLDRREGIDDAYQIYLSLGQAF